MLKRFVVVMMLAVFGVQLVACTEPDDPNWARLNDGVGALPPSASLEAKRWTASENACTYLGKQVRDATILSVTCYDSSLSMNDTFDVSNMMEYNYSVGGRHPVHRWHRRAQTGTR
jgi:hypothetical protein